jgi:hypothetical protein
MKNKTEPSIRVRTDNYHLEEQPWPLDHQMPSSDQGPARHVREY